MQRLRVCGGLRAFAATGGLFQPGQGDYGA
jgi:hypothetical protein